MTSRTTSATNGGSWPPLVSQRQTTPAPASAAATTVTQRVLAVVAPAVEEVLGVVHDALALRDEEPHRVVDHAQVLVAAHVQHLAQVQAPRLADDGHVAREDLGEHAQVVVGLRRHAFAPRHAERDQLRVAQRLVLHAPEELDFLRVGCREPALDEADTEPVELVRDAHLLLDGDRHALLLHAVPQGGVVELYLPLIVHDVYFLAYSMKAPNSSSLPDVMEANRSCMRRVTGPGSPMRWSSTSRIGTISAAVPV